LRPLLQNGVRIFENFKNCQLSTSDLFSFYKIT